MKRGFTILEVVIAIVLLGLMVSFFSSVYQYGYRFGAESRSNLSISYSGQAEMESAIVERIGDAQEYTEKVLSLPEGSPLPTDVALPDLSFKLWNTEIKGYSVRKVIMDRSRNERLQVNVFSFVYPNVRRPVLPETKFGNNNNPVPLFQYAKDLESMDKQYEIKYISKHKGVIRRVVEREYIGSKTKKINGEVYISRPYSDLKADENSPMLVPYSTRFPIGFEFLSKPTGETIVDSAKEDMGLPKNDYSKNIEFKLKYDAPDFTYQDVQVLKTVQAQTVNGYTELEKVVPSTMTWLIGTPVTNGLVGHWDANLVFKQIKLKNPLNRDVIPYTENTDVVVLNSNIDSYETTINSVGDLIQHGTLSSKKLKNDKKRVDLRLYGTSSVPKLLVRQQGGERNGLYRRFSSGIELKGENNRLSLADSRKLMGFRDGVTSYTVIIRAKSLGDNANLFSINMNDKNQIISDVDPYYEANQISIIRNQVNYFYDKGRHNKDTDSNNPRKVHEKFSEPIPESAYNKVLKDNDDERSGYHIFELKLENYMGWEDSYKFSLRVDGKITYLINYGNPNWSDIKLFGLDIGSNLEISDIVVYDRILSDVESKEMSTYLINKYMY